MYVRSLRSADWKERHSAGAILLDRAFGRAAQPIVGENGNPITIMHLVAMREIGEAIVAELVTRQTVIDGHASASETVAPPAELADLGAPATE